MEFLIPGLRHFLVLGTILFSLGMYGVLSRRNAIGILLSIELMLNGVNLLMVAFSPPYMPASASGSAPAWSRVTAASTALDGDFCR